jgi:hypothetical protein
MNAHSLCASMGSSIAAAPGMNEAMKLERRSAHVGLVA